MTALERALVVYAEAKGYEIEVEYRLGFWKNKQYEGKFDFGQCEYKIKQSRGFELGPVTVLRQLTDEITKITNPGFESREPDYPKHEAFSCKTKMYTREEIEEMNKPKESPFETDSPEVRERYAKVTPFILLMEAWAEGEEIEVKGLEHLGWVKTTEPQWNFYGCKYRKAPKTIPATEEELEIIGKGVRWCRNKKDPNRMGWVRHNDKLNSSEWYLFDEQTKTWQDWGSK